MDWFEDKDKDQNRPIVSPASWGNILGTGDVMAMEPNSFGTKEEKARNKRMQYELSMQAEAEQERKLERAYHREAEMDRQAERRRVAEERRLFQQFREGVRDAMIDSAGSAKEAYNALDQNRSGRISHNEFEGGIRALNVKWEDMTGFSKIRELFKLFDHGRKGYITFADLFPLDARRAADPERMSTPEFWKYWCKQNENVSPSGVRGARWDPSGPEERIDQINKGRAARETADEKKQWMKGMIHRLKHRGKSDARCREIVAMHLPRGSGPEDLEKVQTFSEAEVAACRKSYTDKVNESVRKIEKTVYDMHDQRKKLHTSKHQLWQLTEEPMLRLKLQEESRASLIGGLGIGGGGMFGKQNSQVAADADA